MPASIGINLRVTGHCRQGGRKYMEDCFSVAYQQTDDERDLEYAFFGIYDGHGGAEAAAYAKEHLMDIIVRHKSFWSDNDEDVLKAIKDGYIATHYAMWKEQEKWPKTASGLPSTAGTTASVAFIRRGKIYIGHVGDSGIILGYQEPGMSPWKAKALTKEHKPESLMEMARIEQCGGKVVAKSGVPRVVWNRPRIGHKGPVRRSTPIDEIPFLAVARSLGDLWSYNSQLDEFVVSPEPDCTVVPIDTDSFRCLIFGTDGLYNMLSPQMAVHVVQQAEKHNENATLNDMPNRVWLNPSKCLVEEALERWSNTKMRADNTTVVTIMLDPPGPPRAQVLKNRKRNYADSGLQIVTRYENQPLQPQEGDAEEPTSVLEAESVSVPESNYENFCRTFANSCCSISSAEVTENKHGIGNGNGNGNGNENETGKEKVEISCSSQAQEAGVNMKDFVPKPRESLPFDPYGSGNVESSECRSSADPSSESPKSDVDERTIQINEISSSSSDMERPPGRRLTKRNSVGRTKRILTSAENLRHGPTRSKLRRKLPSNETDAESSATPKIKTQNVATQAPNLPDVSGVKQESSSVRSKVLSESYGSKNHVHVTTRSKACHFAANSAKETETEKGKEKQKEEKEKQKEKENDTPKPEAKQTRLARKRTVETAHQDAEKTAGMSTRQSLTSLVKGNVSIKDLPPKLLRLQLRRIDEEIPRKLQEYKDKKARTGNVNANTNMNMSVTISANVQQRSSSRRNVNAASRTRSVVENKKVQKLAIRVAKKPKLPKKHETKKRAPLGKPGKAKTRSSAVAIKKVTRSSKK